MSQTLEINVTGGKVSESIEGLTFEAPSTVQEWIERWGEPTLINLAVRQLKSDIQNGARVRLNGKATAAEVTDFIAKYTPGVKAVATGRKKDVVGDLVAAIKTGTLTPEALAAMPAEAIAALQQKIAEAIRAQRKA